MSNLSSDLARLLMRDIISGKYAVGDVLPTEAMLCSEHACSRVVVREAKKRLQTLGMIRPLKHMGSYVLPVQEWNFFSSDLFSLYLESADDVIPQIENFYALRLQLEPEVSAEVALCRSESCLEDLQTILCGLEEVHLNMTGDELLMIDLDFHMRIYRESRNILLMPMAKLMRPFFLFSFAHARREWVMGFAEHRAIFEAIAAKDTEAARETTATAISNGRERFRAELAEQRALSGHQPFCRQYIPGTARENDQL